LIYPRLLIDLGKIEHNSKIIVNRCKENGLNVIGVTKGCLGDLKVASAMINGGVSGIADSRIINLKKLHDNNFDGLMMLRQPMQDEIKEVVRLTEVCLVSEVETVSYLSEEAERQDRLYKVILMMETGDLREGVPIHDLLKTVDKILKFGCIKLSGIGTNVCLPPRMVTSLDCRGRQADSPHVPTLENFQLLEELADSVKDNFGLELEVISGGSSSAWKLIEANIIPKKVNQMRFGEAMLLGQETTSYKRIKGAYRNAFTIFAEVLEVKEKRCSSGFFKQAIVALGRQDVGNEVLEPEIKGKILRMSADHMVMDISQAVETISLGDVLSFIPEYYALQMAMTSPFVLKEYV